MSGRVLAQPEIEELMKKYVVAELYTDRKDDRHAAGDAENKELQVRRFGTPTLPLYVTLTPEGKETGRIEGIASFEAFREFLESGLTKRAAAP